MRSPIHLPTDKEWPDLIPGDYYTSVVGDEWEVGPDHIWKPRGRDRRTDENLTPPPILEVRGYDDRADAGRD